jgi:hypothetical protein
MDQVQKSLSLLEFLVTSVETQNLERERKYGYHKTWWQSAEICRLPSRHDFLSFLAVHGLHFYLFQLCKRMLNCLQYGVRMNVSIDVCIQICTYLFLCMYICISMDVCSMGGCISINAWMCIGLCVCVYTCSCSRPYVHACLRVCEYVRCVCVCSYAFIRICNYLCSLCLSM